MFGDTGVQICTDGGMYLGGAIGCDDFLRTFLQCKVDEWKEELEILVNIAQSQPLAAYVIHTWSHVEMELNLPNHGFSRTFNCRHPATLL